MVQHGPGHHQANFQFWVLACFRSYWPNLKIVMAPFRSRWFLGKLMPTSKYYRKNAEECRIHAREIHDARERETLLRMAAQWDRLAEHKARDESEGICRLNKFL
jgi:hypothetical protein